MSKVLNMQAKRAANRAARKHAAMAGDAQVVNGQVQRDAYLRGYFDVLDGKEVSLKGLPRWSSKENLQQHRDKLWECNPYLAGAWSAKRALDNGLRIAGYKGRRTMCELDRWDTEMARREEADRAAAKEREYFLRVVGQDLPPASVVE